MTIIIRLDVIMAKRKIRSNQFSKILGITEANLSLLKNGKVKGLKLETLNKICEALNCQPGDLLEFEPDPIKTY